MNELRLRVPEGYSWFFIDDAPPAVDRRLNEEFKYKVPDAEWTDKYKSGDWDGFNELYSVEYSGGPVGFIERATTVIEDNFDYNTTVVWEGDRTGDPIELEWQLDKTPRMYQQAAVQSLLAENGGVISLPTGTGKTYVAMLYCYHQADVLGRPIIYVHTKNLLYQWADRLRDAFGIEPGMIGDGHRSEGPVTVAIMQSLMSKGTHILDGDYGIGIWDECHTTSAADEMQKTSDEIDVAARVGLSATPWRRIEGEELKILGAIGGDVYTADAATMINSGYMAEPEFGEIHPVSGPSWPVANPRMEYQSAVKQCIVENEHRNTAIAGQAIDAADSGRQVFVSVDQIKHGEIITDRINDAMEDGIDPARSLFGRASSDQRDDTFEWFGSGDILVSTLLREGVDIPEIDCIILAHAKKSDVQTIQTVGRALRPEGNFDTSKILHVADNGHWFEQNYKQREQTMSEYYGEFGP